MSRLKKRICCCLLMITLMLTSVPIQCQAQDGYIKKNINVEYSDSQGKISSLSILIKGNDVYLNAKEIADAFEMNYSADDEKIALYTREPKIGLTQFYIGSNQVKHLVVTKLVEYKAPYDCIAYDDVVWIPFEYSLLLLNSGYVIIEDTILIDKPRDTILDVYNEVSKNCNKYAFLYQDDFGYTDGDVTVTGGASHLINVFSGLLVADGAAWSEIFRGIAKVEMFPGEIPSAYDVKYGRELATLLCTYSDSELKAAQKKIKKSQDLLSPNGKLGKFITKRANKYDKELGNAYDSLKKCVEECYPNDTVTISKARNTLDDLLDKSNSFSKTSAKIADIQNSFSGVMTYLDVAMSVAEIVGYVEEFRNKDNFSLSALDEYLTTDDDLSSVLRLSLQSNLALLKSDELTYSSERFLCSKVPSWIGKGLSITEGLAAEPTLLAWNLASTFIPFISNGLSDADKYELSLYGICIYASSFNKYVDQKSYIFSSPKNLKSDELYRLSKLCYIYLKSCMVTRSAAVGSLENKKMTIPDAVNQIEIVQESINDEISGLLVKLETATENNENLEYGFLPEDSEVYNSQYDGEALLQRIINMKTLESEDDFVNSAPNDLDESKPISKVEYENLYHFFGVWNNYDTADSISEMFSLDFANDGKLSACIYSRVNYSGAYVIDGNRFRADLELDEWYNNATASWEHDEGHIQLDGKLNGTLNVYMIYDDSDEKYGPYILTHKEENLDDVNYGTDISIERMFELFEISQWDEIRDMLGQFEKKNEYIAEIYDVPEGFWERTDGIDRQLKDNLYIVIEYVPEMSSWQAYMGELDYNDKKSGLGVMVSSKCGSGFHQYGNDETDIRGGGYIGGLYIGEWRDDYPNGKGAVISSIDSDYYLLEGNFCDGRFDGNITVNRLRTPNVIVAWSEYMEFNIEPYEGWDYSDILFDKGKLSPVRIGKFNEYIDRSKNTDRELFWLDVKTDNDMVYRTITYSSSNSFRNEYVMSIGVMEPHDGYRGRVDILYGWDLFLINGDDVCYGFPCHNLWKQ